MKTECVTLLTDSESLVLFMPLNETLALCSYWREWRTRASRDMNELVEIVASDDVNGEGILYLLLPLDHIVGIAFIDAAPPRKRKVKK